MLKKILVNIAIYILPGVILYLGYYAYKQHEYNSIIEERIGQIPQMSFLTLEGDSISFEQKGKTTVLIEFNPGCDYCQKEATDIINNKENLSHLDIYFISKAPLSAINKFRSEYKFTETDQFTFLQDQYYEMDKFPSVIIPSTYIYNEKGELLFYNFGITEAQDIIEESK